MYILIILIFLLIALVEAVPLYKKKRKKELILYLIFFNTGLTLSLLMSFGVKIPQVSKGISKIFQYIIQK